MKKLIFAALPVIIILALLTTNCKEDQSPFVKPQADVQFNLNSVVENGNLKSTPPDIRDIKCSDLKADYVMYTIDDEPPKKIDVFYVGNIPWTNSIKLDEGNHTIKEFIVYNNNMTPDITEDDIEIMATPHTGSEFAGFVTTPLNLSFSTTVDKKNEVKLDVVCFQPMDFNSFGFTYFYLNELTIRQLWFFGDFCIKNKADYAGSDYAMQTGWNSSLGAYIDAPAIIKVEVYRNGVLQNTYDNNPQGEKLDVCYGDYKNKTDNFEIKLYILVKQGSAFNYVLFKTWNFNDVSNILQGSDGVVDFVLGNCYDPLDPPDFIFPPWMNLPLTVTYTITGSYAPGSMGGYVDATLSNLLPAGIYDIEGIKYASYCADRTKPISPGTPYTMYAYSSLYPPYSDIDKWAKINWVYNHLSWYKDYKWSDIQGLVWLFEGWDGNATGGMPALLPDGLAHKMYLDAQTYGAGYKVPPGGWAAIIFIKDATIQTMFIQIDP